MPGVAAVHVLSEDGVLAAEVVAPREASLADAARDARVNDDPVADLPGAGARPEGLHLADDVAAEAVRVLELEVRDAAANPEIEVVEGDGLHANPDLARPGLRKLEGLAEQNLGTPVGAKDDGLGLHGRESLVS
jgi:hypothetical protein